MDYFRLYAEYLSEFLDVKQPLRVVFDCSNGTTGLVLKNLFAGKQTPIEAKLINERPDGNFPAHGPNPLAKGALDQLASAVVMSKSDLGAVFDADGDRVFFTDNLGRLVRPAAAILLLVSRFAGDLALPVNVGPFVKKALSKIGRKAIDSRVGHYFLKKLIKEKQLDFAAEQSGHYYFKEFFGLDSGILAALEFINAAADLRQPLAQWINQLPPHFISEEINFEVADKAAAIAALKEKYGSSAKKTSELDGLSMEFDQWWFNVRPSNTENLLRLNLEAESESWFKEKLTEITDLLFLQG